MLRPDSAAHPARPTSSYIVSPNALDRPEPRRAISTHSTTSSSKRSSFLKAASDSHMNVSFRNHATRQKPSPSPSPGPHDHHLALEDDDHLAAEAPVISMGTQPHRDRAQSLKQQSRRSVFRPFANTFSFRSRPVTPSLSPPPPPQRMPHTTATTPLPRRSSISDRFPHFDAASFRSARSSPPIAGSGGLPQPKSLRSRSGTNGSFPGHHAFPNDSGRNSTASTTLGRNSMAAIRSFTSKLRTSDALSRRGTPHELSNSNSFAISRETLVIPERDEGETSGKYYARLETEGYPKRVIALSLSKANDSFSHDTLRSLARTFKFFEEPIDIALRKFLWEIPLTGEAQQIDRVMSAFSERYHECNPHIFSSADDANYVAFSLVILHSDLFNPSVKNKMQRTDYQKNTRDIALPGEVLGYFYDNIAFTEFVHEEIDKDSTGKRSKSAYAKAKKVKAKLTPPEQTKVQNLDPYEIILDDELSIDSLKHALRNDMLFEDPYTYMGTSNRFDIPSLRTAFNRYGILNLVSERSRPEAYAESTTINDPKQAQAGIVPIKVAKLGIVWRKSGRKRKTRSPWKEWGIILTQSQLYFYRNATFVKGLMTQAESHQKRSKADTAVVFKPPLTSLGFDATLTTHGAIALLDTNYKRHKHAFVLARKPHIHTEHASPFEETILADSDADMNDWIAKINYASTFQTTNVRMNLHPPRPRRRSSTEEPEIDSDPATTPELEVSPAIEALARQHQARTRQTVLEEHAKTRAQLAKAKFTAIEDEARTQVKCLEDNLRIARHLEILRPFLPKTRDDLLNFGARLAQSIRWNRYDVLRLKCHREVLFKDLQEDED